MLNAERETLKAEREMLNAEWVSVK